MLGTASPIKKTLVASERSAAKRQQFLNDLSVYLQAPERLVFLDESGFNTSLTRGYARAPSHQRAVGRVPRNHGLNQTLICTLSLAGPAAALVLDGALTGEVFAWYVRELVCPILVPGQVIVLDNLTSHHHAAIRPLIEAQGCEVLFLAPYSPDFNPIELLFSKLTAWGRAQACRTVPALIDAIGTALTTVTRADIAHWFHHAHPRLFL